MSVRVFIHDCDQRKPCWKCWTMAVWWRFVALSLSTIHVQRSVWVFGTCSKLWRSDWELKAATLWIFTGVYHGLPEKWESTKSKGLRCLFHPDHSIPLFICNILWLQILQQHGTMLSTSSIGAKYHLRKERWLQLLQLFFVHDVFGMFFFQSLVSSCFT